MQPPNVKAECGPLLFNILKVKFHNRLRAVMPSIHTPKSLLACVSYIQVGSFVMNTQCFLRAG